MLFLEGYKRNTIGCSANRKGQERETSLISTKTEIDAFISLWQEFYDKHEDENKALMPLYPIFSGN
jgi:hypothetical protein